MAKEAERVAKHDHRIRRLFLELNARKVWNNEKE
jgi:hypothetical protein